MSTPSKHQVVTAGYIQAPRMGVVIRTPAANIRYFQFADKYCSAVTTGGTFLLDMPLHEIAEVFADKAVRVHRSYVVMRNVMVRACREVGTHRHWLYLDDGSRVPVSRDYYKSLKAILEKGHE